MDQTDQKDIPDQKDRTPIYEIGVHRYRLEPLSWQQQQWLGESVFKDADIAAIDYGAIHDMGRTRGPLFMAICLLREGQTRKEKSLQPWREILALAEEFRGELSGMEVASFCTHFFFCCQPGQMAMLVPGRAMQQLFVEAATKTADALAAPGGTGSSTASSPLPAAISASSVVFDPSGARLNQSPICDDALSMSPPSVPSLVSVESGSPG